MTAHDTVQEIVRRHGLPGAPVVSITGHGSLNHVFVLGSGHDRIVMRTPVDRLRADEFEVERWCLEQATSHGIPTPGVMARGDVTDVPYIVLTFVDGDHPNPTDLAPWDALGRYGRVVHGFDYTRGPAGLFTRFGRDPGHAWHQHLAYNTKALTKTDPLIGLGVYTPADRPRLCDLVDRLGARDFGYGVCHGDLAPRNLLRTRGGTLVLLDWGQASVGLIPHGDLLDAYRAHVVDSAMTEAEFDAFIAAMTGTEAPSRDVLHDLMVLDAVDKVRWALDKRPDRVSSLVTCARNALQA